MKRRRIITALRSAGIPRPRPSDACLSPESLAAYADGEASAAVRDTIETHLAVCDYCTGQIAAISRAAAESTVAAVPDSLRAQAEALFKTGAEQQGGSPSVRWAVAAVLVLAIGLLVAPNLPEPGAPAEPPARQIRVADKHAMQPHILAPAEGSVVQTGGQVFRWSEVPGSLFYEVRLVSADGDLLLRERVEDTRWLIPAQLRLQSGEDYYVRVDAYLGDAKLLSSEHLSFQVEGTQ